jgi:outer membrane protein OmpA-like peptidoglycan-associated protein
VLSSEYLLVEKDGKNIETQEFAVPISTNDSTTITKDFYVPYIDTLNPAYATLKPIYFDTDKYKLRPESITELNRISEVLKANPGINISIEGNCDSRNTDEYNMVLGQNRADVAYNYLKKQGVAETRMVTVSYGERRPAAPNDSPENMQLNRRTDFRVITKEGDAAPVLSNPAPASGANSTGSSSTGTSTTTTAPLQPGKSKAKLPDGTKVKTKVDEDSDKVKVKTKGANDEKSKTVTKDGTIDSKAKDADGAKTKVKTDND